jgi:hypothetical protein
MPLPRLIVAEVAEPLGVDTQLHPFAGDDIAHLNALVAHSAAPGAAFCYVGTGQRKSRLVAGVAELVQIAIQLCVAQKVSTGGLVDLVAALAAKGAAKRQDIGWSRLGQLAPHRMNMISFIMTLRAPDPLRSPP